MFWWFSKCLSCFLMIFQVTVMFSDDFPSDCHVFWWFSKWLSCFLMIFLVTVMFSDDFPNDCHVFWWFSKWLSCFLMIFQVSLVILWGLILLLIIVFYTELCRLKPFSPHSSCHTVSSPQKHSSHQTNARFAGTVRSGLGASYKVIEHDDGFSSSQPVSIPASAISSDCSQETPEPQLARSSQMIEEVEKYIQKMAEQSYTSASARKPLGIDYCSSENGEQQLSSELSEETSGRLSESFSDNPEWSSALALGRGAHVAGDVSLMSSGTTDQGSYIQRYGALPYNLQGQESVFYILYQGGSVSSILRQWVCLLHPVSMGLSSRSCIGGSVFYILHWWVCRPLRYQWVCLPHPVSVGLSPPSCIIGSVSPILY